MKTVLKSEHTGETVIQSPRKGTNSMNRRHFLIGSVAASAARASTGETGTVNTGFIGAGNRGSHLLKLTLDEPAAKVAAVCDIKPDRLDRAATIAARDQPRSAPIGPRKTVKP